MPSWPAMVDENRVRLRASCNACNESKVRCSQQKPTCARCERNETECIYGLSRRTHKDAPPISIPSSQRGRGPSRPGRPPRLPSSCETRSSTSTRSNSMSKTATRSNSAMPDEPAEAHNNNANLLDDFMFSTATETDSMHGVALLDLSNLVTGSTGSTSMAPGYFSTTGAEYANSTPWHGESLFGANHNSDAIGMGVYQALDGGGGCTCHTGVTELLASMRGGGGGGGGSNDHRLSPDAQLAKLNQCIMSSETSMGCAHGREDSEPIHIMAIAMLIGYALDGFKMLASESSLRRSSSLSSPAPAAEMATLGNAERGSRSGVATPCSINMSLGGLMEPRLSWGVLELEEDDEMDLRQRLYLLSFRKLERVLSRLTLHIRDLHIALASIPDPSRHLAFVIACDSTRLWLEKKAGDVKRLFAVAPRDEIMDSALS
ncbi:hypothetical protein BCR34DRAFT_581401 [Clohesyomyces aquaticus]|uniref:Zn(2)-C6 fungal-type domain-containing protein n=1 Tax=Clohesyomyces aquaticus TaxID=1231657 RepID=A0A1Y1Y1N2_9PLEO|nr:hypothetical protein BCR34DRAFT_581401 [Clohesyomyces aquaticus]